MAGSLCLLLVTALLGNAYGADILQRIFEARSIPSNQSSRANKIDAEGCGLRPLLSDNGASELYKRIVGGVESEPYSWPSICSLRPAQYESSHICGSTLVKNKQGEYYLITAAHCLDYGKTPESYVAYCGIHDPVSNAQANRHIIRFSSLTYPIEYSDATLDRDIAIFKPSVEPPTNDYIQPACIQSTDWVEGGQAIVAGWGDLEESGSASKTLRQVIKPIQSREACRAQYGTAAITDRMMCAGYEEGGKDACQGDSGGPMYTFINKRWYLTGIVSWGLGCARTIPGVYADVLSLHSWIDQNIN